MRKRQFDYEKIIRMDEQGFTPFEIADAIGAKSTYHIRTIIRRHKRKLNPDLRPKQKPGRTEEYTPLDIGKVKALQKAGWSIEKIFKEFGERYPVARIREAMNEIR